MYLPCRRLFILILSCYSVTFATPTDNFSEELFIKQFPNNYVYTFFQFTTTWSSDELFQHCHLFPRSLGEIISRYQIEELHLSLTEGLWRHINWGYPIVDAPPGAELYTWFSEKSIDVDSQWKELSETLSGLFCASLNFIDNSNSLSPKLSFRPSGISKNRHTNSSFIRYATLPREIVCTENLTPWKKLLPCDSKRGLATLLNSGRLHNTNYHSLGIHFRSICADEKCKSKMYELRQTMSLVYDSEIVGSRDWSVQKLFGQGIPGPCPLAKSSLLYVDVTSNETRPFTLSPAYDRIETSMRGGSKINLAVYNMTHGRSSMFNVAAIHSTPSKISVLVPPPLHVSRFIAGYGQERGSIVTNVYNNHWQPIDIVFLENIPWFLPVYLQTLKIVSNGQVLVPTSKHYVPGRGKSKPYYLEFTVRLPPKSITKVSIEFDYVFLKWQEYPPDANHGFYVGSAVITALLPVAKNFISSVSYPGTIASSVNESRSGYIVQLHTESMIITLPTPDFSMPYNVICLACTVVALAFGPLHNITTKSLQLKLDSSDHKGNIIRMIKDKFRRKSSNKQSEPPIEEPEKPCEEQTK